MMQDTQEKILDEAEDTTQENDAEPEFEQEETTDDDAEESEEEDSE